MDTIDQQQTRMKRSTLMQSKSRSVGLIHLVAVVGNGPPLARDFDLVACGPFGGRVDRRVNPHILPKVHRCVLKLIFNQPAILPLLYHLLLC